MSNAVTRRTFLATSAASAAALSAPMIMTRAAHGAAPMLGPSSASFYRFKLGAFEVTTLLDGARSMDGPHPIFGQDQEAAAVAELMTENRLPAEKMVLGFTPTLVNTGSELVLFDTGLGAGARAGGMGQLTKIMGEAGYTPDQVDVVVITHMHPDHVGGLMEEGKPTFPNARYVANETEYQFWRDEARIGTPIERVYKAVEANVVPITDQVTFIGDDTEVTGGVTGMAAFGHTPGHMVYHLESEGRRLLLTADTANHFVASLQRPDWQVRFDIIKDAAAETRKKVFDMVASERIPFVGYHMPFPSVGYVEKMGPGYRYVAETYQMEL